EPESFGRVAVEAQAMGRPVIATAHGGSLETIRQGETGLLVDPFDPSAMTAACERMLAWSPADRAEMGARGRRWVLKQFTVEQMCDAEFDAYLQLLGLAGNRSTMPGDRAEAA
ncbi:MAG: glycosyltransferase family 4 protein, partial [Pirellulales bacterium]